MNVTLLDLEFQGSPKTIASYLVEGSSGYVLIETGPGSTLDSLVARLAENGVSPKDIEHVLVTHIHLDHAGAAGWLAQQGAIVFVHHVGAPHLIDPSRLLESAGRIYGAKLESLWGETLAAPAGRVVAVHDGEKIEAAGLTFTALDTPGHAYHHHVFVIDEVAFTGDAAGIRIEGTSFVDLPAPPPEFNLEAWMKTIARLRSLKLKAVYPTHFGRLEDPDRQLATLAELMEETTTRIRRMLEEGASREAIMEDYLAWSKNRARQSGISSKEYQLYELVNPHYMSMDGIIRYWKKKGIPSGEQSTHSAADSV